MKSIATIIGARPQFIKAAALSSAIKDSTQFSEVLIHTGQHYDSNMSEVFFDQLKIPRPDYQLNINNSNHGEMTGRMMIEIEKILLEIQPDVVLVYGDTNSTLAGALVARKLKFQVAHVEAGLRSFNMEMPEEINRIITDRISNILFCPSESAFQNLQNEGYSQLDVKIIRTGDIMYDTVQLFQPLINKSKSDYCDSPFVLATIHREENTNDPIKLGRIIEALNQINKKIRIVLPLHPRTKKKISEADLTCNFEIIDPTGYIEMMRLVKDSELIITDSGGLQKEAYFFQKKCLTLRDQTEWVELVNAGYNLLSPIDVNAINENFNIIFDRKISFGTDLYGDGTTSQCILSTFEKLIH